MVLEKVKNGLCIGDLTKKNYLDALKEDEEYILNLLKKVGYVYSEDVDIKLFGADENVRLAEAENKAAESDNNINVAIADYVKYASTHLRSFLKKYHIGWLEEFYARDAGTFCAKIQCSISARGDDNSDKVNLERDLAELRKLGFEVRKAKYGGYELPDTIENQRLVYNLIEERGGRLIEITLRHNTVDSVSFRVRPADIDKFEEEVTVVRYDVTDELNPDEIAVVNRLINVIHGHISSMAIKELSTSTLYRLIEYEFAELCDVFGYSGEISTQIKSKHADAKKKNQLIREVEESIGEKFPCENARDAVESVRGRINRFGMEHFGFYVDTFKIDQYGYIQVKLNAHSGYPLGRHPISEEETSKIFETVGTSRRMDDFFLVDSSDNKRKICKLLSDNIPSCEIKTVEAGNRDGEFYIKSISIFIRNVLDVFSLPEENEYMF